MDWFTGTVVFLLIWWVVIFAVLPFGLKRDITGKPENVRMGRVFLITTALTLIIWSGFYLLIESDIISFREMAAARAVQENTL